MTFEQQQVQAGKIWQHARGCKKPPSDCAACQINIKWFSELPLDTLSQILREKGQ
jgi:hypothetical protein